MTNYIRMSLLLAASSVLISCSNTSSFLPNQTLSGSDQSVITRSQLTDDSFWQGNPNVIWNRLQQIRLSKLERLASQISDPYKSAWLKLAIISKRYTRDSNQLIEQLKRWRTEYPNHPGNSLFRDDGLLAAAPNLPKHIALLLPLQGRTGPNGQAVRDGFLNAYYQNKSRTHIEQTISFYDTSSNPNMSALHQQALNEGADIVVGPLMKEDVESLSKLGTFSAPILALNYTEGSLPNNFYEFGLSPVDEVQQVADKAWQSGRSRAIVIAPQNAWGQRVTKNLMSRWQSLGGTTIDTFYFSNSTNFTQAIPDLLHVNTTEDRKKMQAENNKTILEKQRRQDFDVIFLLSEPKVGRNIVPLLKYYYAENIPIYATSSIYAGSPNPQKDADLNGVIFADIPWLIKSTHTTNRLYAVGHDAYVISNELSRLNKLPNFPIYAATGALTLTDSHRIYRRLPWAKMHNGHP